MKVQVHTGSENYTANTPTYAPLLHSIFFAMPSTPLRSVNICSCSSSAARLKCPRQGLHLVMQLIEQRPFLRVMLRQLSALLRFEAAPISLHPRCCQYSLLKVLAEGVVPWEKHGRLEQKRGGCDQEIDVRQRSWDHCGSYAEVRCTRVAVLWSTDNGSCMLSLYRHGEMAKE